MSKRFVAVILVATIFVVTICSFAVASIEAEKCPGDHTWEVYHSEDGGLTQLPYTVSSCANSSSSHTHYGWQGYVTYYKVCIECGEKDDYVVRTEYKSPDDTCSLRDYGR